MAVGELHVLAVVQPPGPAEDIETEALLEAGQERFDKEFVLGSRIGMLHAGRS